MAFNIADDEKEKQREQQRRESLKQMVGDEENKTENKEKSQENSEKDEKGLDFDQKNSYISNDDGEQEGDQDEERERLQAIVDKTFGGDPFKAVKSWREAQRSFSQMREEFQQVKAERDSVNQILKRNPSLAQLFEKAYKGELGDGDNIQNFLKGAGESTDKPTSPSRESKLGAIEKDVSVDTLINQGYVNRDDLEVMGPEQKQLALQRARIEYMMHTFPKQMAEEASKQYQERISQQQKELEQREERKKNVETNRKRYREGINKVVDEFGLDFTGQDKQLLDDIEKVATHIVDPSNPYVIDEDAVYLATQKVLRMHGREVTPTPYKSQKEQVKQKENSMYEKNTFNTSTRNTDAPDRPRSIADKLREKRMSQFQRDMELRRKPK